MSTPAFRRTLSSAVCLAFVLASSASAAELPSQYQAVSGSSSYSTSADGNSGTLNATSSVTIGQWAGGFDIGEGKTFTANLPSGGRHLSHDITSDPSVIFGTMNVPNGRFFLVNTNGIVFAPNSRVNASGLVASSLDILNSDFTAGNYRFAKPSGKSPATVSNAGTIAAGTGGVALVGGAVHHQGTITAAAGSVLLASGEAMTLQLDANGDISALIDVPAASSPAGRTDAVRQTGLIRAGRNVTLTAEAADAVFANLVNMTGLSVTEAGSARSEGGVIELVATGGRASLNGAVNPSAGGTLRIRARQADFSRALDGPFNLEVFADDANINAAIGASSPLGEVTVEAGTIRLGDITTTGTQAYTNVPFVNEHFTEGFETELNGDLTATGATGGIVLRGATRLNADVTLKTSGDFSTVTLGYSDSFRPGRIDGAHTLTVDAAGGEFRIEDSGRFGGSYEVGTSEVPLTALRLIQADAAYLGPANVRTRSLDLTAHTMSLFGTFETYGQTRLLATTMALEGAFRSNGSMNLKAASIRMAGDFSTTGGSIVVNGPATLAASYTPFGDPVKPQVQAEGGGVTFFGPVRLDEDAYVASSGGNVTFNSTVNANHWAADDLAIDAGAGNVVMNGGIGYNPATGQGTRIGRLSIRRARDVTFGSHVSVSSLYQAASAAPATTVFRGPVDAYHVSGIELIGHNFTFTAPVRTSNGGTFTVTNACVFSTTAAADFALDGAFLQDGAGPSRIAGDIRTTNDAITFRRAVTLTGDAFMGTGAGAGNIAFGGTLYGTTSGQEDLTLSAGTGNISFAGKVGYDPVTATGVRIGRLFIQNAFNVTASSIITAASILQGEGTGTTTLRGFLRTNQPAGVSLTGNNFVLNGAAATGGPIAVNYRGTVTLNGTYTPAPTVRKRS